MAKEICISSTPHETRLAILEDDQLAEVYYERENEYTLAGSIYNGRVTRVLPGMQSAFVDIGLERDAFLYVTDFLELEDQEESDELEKAATAGGAQPPREVRHSSPRDGQRRERKPSSDSQESQVQAPLAVEPVDAPEFADDAPKTEDDSDGAAKRWRGRRRRRGGRSQSLENETGENLPVESAVETETPGLLPEPAPARETPRPPREAAPFVLPGESLSRYGGTPADEKPRATPAAPQRP
ncbi:MAG TPA: hypothetical protein VLT57_07780, partial [Bryobacteraceae bacterium]|nr:hypothetical protein [Bryobacteraceae bacterium]